MIASLLILMVPSAFCALLLAHLKVAHSKEESVCAGIVMGLTVFATLAYLISLVGERYSLRVIVPLFLFAWGTGYLVRKKAHEAFSDLLSLRPNLIFWALGTVISVRLATRLFFEEEGALYTGILSAFGDVAWHSANITAFAEGQSFPPQNPILSGTTLVYPFLLNYLSALFMESGLSLSSAIVWPAGVLLPVLLTLFFLMARKVTGSAGSAHLATLLFMVLGSTLGFTRLGSDFAQASKGFLDMVFHLPHQEYSGRGSGGEGLYFLNPILSLMLPQRNYLLGMPIAFFIVLQMCRTEENRKGGFVSGLLFGMLPLVHLHTMMVLGLILPVLAFFQRDRRWVSFAVGAAIFGIPETAYFLKFNAASGHIKFHFGWMAESPADWFGFWFRNTGLYLPVLIACMFSKAPKSAKQLGGVALLIFVLGNTIQFAKWSWDNYKILIFFWILGAPLVSYCLVRLLEQEKSRWRVGIASFYILFQSATGALDLWKTVLPTADRWPVFNAAAVAAGEEIRKYTPHGASILSHPTFNAPTFLAGRYAYLGYPAHVWSHGGEYHEREAAIRAFYQAERLDLPDTKVDFILVGPEERMKYRVLLRADWEVVFETPDYQLFKFPH